MAFASLVTVRLLITVVNEIKPEVTWFYAASDCIKAADLKAGLIICVPANKKQTLQKPVDTTPTIDHKIGPVLIRPFIIISPVYVLCFNPSIIEAKSNFQKSEDIIYHVSLLKTLLSRREVVKQNLDVDG